MGKVTHAIHNLTPANGVWSKPVAKADTGTRGHGDTGILEKNSPRHRVSPSPRQSQPTTYDHTPANAT